jgi:ABC-type sulfate transport system permease subunit
MKGIYLIVMHFASQILFAVAGIVLLASFISVAFTLLSPTPSYGMVGDNDGLARLTTIVQIIAVFQPAVWPFFGAALLYRIDKWMERP